MNYPKNCMILFEHCTKNPKGYGSTTSINTRAALNYYQELCGGILFGSDTFIRVNVNLAPSKLDQDSDAFKALNEGGGVPVLVLSRGYPNNIVFK